MKIILFIGLFIGLPMLTFAQTSPPAPLTQLGVAHIGGLYCFSEIDYLNEGAVTARAIGARCIKVSLSLDTDNPSPKLYPFHSQWPTVATLDALADTPYYRTLFAREFDTFILTAFRPSRSAGYWRESFSDEDEQAEEECFASLTGHLLRTYAQSRKTFIIQNWEGDWALRGSFDPNTKPTPAATAAMIRWLAARQRGVARARTEFATGGARVFHACEVNLVRQAQVQGAPGVTTDVLPHVPVDLASYSAWDTKDSPAHFAEALAFIAKHKRRTEPFGEHGVYVGEFGLPESEATPQLAFERTAALLVEAQRFGCPYAVYWQLYCNEPTTKPPKVNGDYKGFWLLRPDGTRSTVCRLFQ
ncbi:MAG: hypothetical protein ORN83_00120 [Chthoniobacteraceae bacterium]|nr:hypothetical protein [Chthoniobacteraceae bacterium]